MSVLKPEAKQKLVEALRSGQYKQTVQGLKFILYEDNNLECYCVLGVLCEVSGVGSWEQEEVSSTFTPSVVCYAYTDALGWSSELPPGEVIEWAFGEKLPMLKDLPNANEFLEALSKIVPEEPDACSISTTLPTYTVTEVLANANDCGASFKDLADVIEQYL